MRSLVAFVLLLIPVFLYGQEYQPPAAALVREARIRQEWLNGAQSVQMRFEGTRTLSKKCIERATKNVLKRDPSADPSADPSLAPVQPMAAEVQFTPMALRLKWDTAREKALRIWDGHQYVARIERRSQTHYEIDKNADLLSLMFGELLGFQSIAVHPFVFADSRERTEMPLYGVGPASDYWIERSENFRGKECWLVTRDILTDYFFEKDDRRLRGIRVRTQLDNKADAASERAADAIRKLGPEFAPGLTLGGMDADRWQVSLSSENRVKFNRAVRNATEDAYGTLWEFWFDDYIEVRHGALMPASLARASFHDGEEFTRDEWKLQEISLDKPLDVKIFQIAIPKGATVQDQSVRPWKTYVQQ